ncbi:unnamed protein product [Lasius platythorax]|uniref:Uncharacterized protein n=1 Tax=Lasius platythorax TaxID=488582 RepID=A0AAV2N0B7_9HYME
MDRLRSESHERSKDLIELCRQYFEHLQSGDGRVPNQGRGGQSFVFFIHACLDKEPTAPTEDVRPVVVRYHIKGNIVHRFYGEDPETLVAVSTVEQASDEPMHLTSRARDDGVATSTPVTSSGPRVVSCVSGTFIDDAVFERPRSSDDKTVAGDTGIPAPRAMASFSMEELLGQYFDPPTTTVIDGASDCHSDASLESNNTDRGRLKRPRSTGTTGSRRVKPARSKAPTRDESRLAPLAGEMRPEAAKLTSSPCTSGTNPEAGETRRERRRQSSGDEQPRVVLDRV